MTHLKWTYLQLMLMLGTLLTLKLTKAQGLGRAPGLPLAQNLRGNSVDMLGVDGMHRQLGSRGDRASPRGTPQESPRSASASQALVPIEGVS